MDSNRRLLKRFAFMIGAYLICLSIVETRRRIQTQVASNEIIVIPMMRMITLYNKTKLSSPKVDYSANVFITTQPLNFTFDTGSQEIWIPYWDGKRANLRHDGTHAYIDNESQPSYGEKKFTYRRVGFAGTIYDDIFTFRGKKGNTEEAYEIKFNQNFMAVKDADNAKFKDRLWNGVIGLPAISYMDAKSRDLELDHVLNRIYPGESMKPPADHHLKFSLWYDHKDDNLLDKIVPGGEITIGGFNSKKGDNKINIHKIVGDGWRVNLTNAFIGNYQTASNKKDRMAELDSGSYFMTAPEEQAKYIYNSIGAYEDKNSDLMMVNCSKFQEGDEKLFPDLYFQIDEAEYTLKRQFYITQLDHPSKGKYCFVNIRANNVMDEWTLGTSFLRAFYTTYDSYYGEVGIAESKQG